ncbi:receptor-mediated endocytosis protein 6 homolog [Zerene cesonia]|uniref:receptor-mediated endocytosis protein 6 homolog n=1 Tax=Zerene cesonia TaxID=33412 RepID=UPI0018E53D80|nr:receptor-mediated endocytosis protein 6 homolog [Zerene cesonia]
MMQSNTEGCMNIAELANQLRREKIFINSERQLLQNLNEELEKSALELLQQSWICSQQRQNLTNLITSRCEADSIAACQRASLLESTTFIDVYKVLKYKEANALGELLGWLKDTPHLMALCLMLGEEHMPPSLPSALVAGLYGSCRSPLDRTRLLAVIRSLIKHQMAPSSDPRKLFRTNKCALSSLYSIYRDGHSPARQFLVAALQGPVMAVLHEDEFFLDADPDKAMERFSPADRLKKFGQSNSSEYSAKVARYRKWTVQSLYNLTSKFIAALREYWPNFPTTIAWIVQQIVHLLKQHSRITEREVHAICTDLVFNHFICPAIVNPEAHGVVDIPVSYIARFNLIQIAQIIQMLCLARYQEVEPKVRDLYTKFERSCVWSLIEAVTSPACGPAPPAPPAPDAPLRTDAPPRTQLALYTYCDVHALITFLRRISSKLNNNASNGNAQETNGSASSNEVANFGLIIITSGGSSALPSFSSLLLGILGFGTLPSMPRLLPQFSGVSLLSGVGLKIHIAGELAQQVVQARAVVGLESVQQRRETCAAIAALAVRVRCLQAGGGGAVPGGNDVYGRDYSNYKLLFSVSHDEVSLGNTSDNLEAVSEAASNHSVTSSLELETEDQNDNMSDMVSANVSGRGSPNISGRETPSSQVTDGDTAGDQPPRRAPQNAPVNQASSANQAKLLKQTRNEIEDKFCKFEIKKLLEGDETISIMSDTWSTDVLASDSETIGDTCDHAQNANTQGSTGNNTNVPDVSETASESAWSVDVLASDSDRNTEVDTDDCVSVAARPDTSWPRRPSAHDDCILRPQNGTAKRPDMNSPRHTPRANLPHSPNETQQNAISRRSSVGLWSFPGASWPNSYRSVLDYHIKIYIYSFDQVMTCYATSAPESPSTAPAQLTADVFDYPQNNNNPPAENPEEEADNQHTSTGSDATSQWVTDSFPRLDGFGAKYMPSTSKGYEESDPMDRSLNSSESSFNALSVSQCGRFDGEPERPERPDEPRVNELIARMSCAAISRSSKSEIRTSVVNISSSRIERRRDTRDVRDQATSNISLSTLSVNSETSVSAASSSQDVNSENVTERRVSPPPAKLSTGAIPKSISFDATAEKTQRRRLVGEEIVGNLDELKSNVKRSGGNLLHKIKMFRQKGRSHHSEVKVTEEDVRSDDRSTEGGESSEEILAKYRRHADSKQRKLTRRPSDVADTELDKNEGVVDLNDPEVFDSMKRRLRTVLSNTDFHCVEYVPNRCSSTSLAEWVRAGRGAGAAAAARALAAAGAGARAARLAAALRADLAARRPYAAYLATCRAARAHALHDLRSQIKLVRWEVSESARCAGAARVLEQLERGAPLRRLARHHAARAHHAVNGGELMDEKATRLTASIKAITAEVKADPSWEGATPTVVESVEVTVERAVFARLYLQVLFPNGDGDIARDQVLSEHMRRLAACTSARGAGVAARHAWAAPFPHAQALLRHLPVYRTPRDKVACIMRVVSSLMAVLSLTDGSPPAADDLTPVLVLVILKVNPPSLLSTIELVNALGGGVLAGEALYWWTQFCAAVAYIKTMDYAPDT